MLLISKPMNQYAKIQKEIEKEKDLRAERSVIIAQLMLEELVNNKISLKTADFESVMKEYKPVYVNVIERAKKEGWLVNDIIYAVNFFMRLTENLKNVFELSLMENQDKAIEKVIGKNITKLTVNDVDSMLKK